MLKPYSPEVWGDLDDYLRRQEDDLVDIQFQGFEYFFKIKDMRLMVPGRTCIRVSNGFVPDISYFVNSDYLLESRGRGYENMSLVGGEKCVYNPEEILRNRVWSISGLDFLGFSDFEQKDI